MPAELPQPPETTDAPGDGAAAGAGDAAPTPSPAELPQPPTDGEPQHLAPLGGGAGAIALLLVLVALGATFVWLRLPQLRSSDEDHAALAAALSAVRHPGEPVFTAPAWAQRPRAFVDGLQELDPATLGPEDGGAARMIHVIATPDAPRSDASATLTALSGKEWLRAGEARSYGRLVLQSFTVARQPPVFQLSADLAEVTGSTEEGPCRFDGEGLRCPGGPWMRLQTGEHEVERKGRRCVFLHPPREGALRLVLPAMPGRRVVVGVGFASSVAALDPEGAPVELALLVDGRARGSIELRPGDERWHRVELDLPAGEGPLELRLSSPRDARRHLCAEVTAW